jgi:membrane-bound lytic murein transglycosylase B
MSAPERRQGAIARTAHRSLRVRTPHPRTFAAVVLCSLLTAATAPASPLPGGVFDAVRANAAGVGPIEMALPDRSQSRAPSPADSSNAAPATPGQAVVFTSSATTAAPVPPVVVSMLASDGIPVVASRAYHHAADLANQRTVNCGLPWTLLAAIGRVESDHGRFAGSVLLANGLSTPRIIGSALNGVGTALVLDTDHGVLDGDPVYDHAVGPMQFIPSTWAQYATDGNGDGVADPFNIYDAAASAGKYLCTAGTDLRTRAGKIRAVLTYNHSDSYVASVLALEATYAGTPIIAGPAPKKPILSAPLPPVNPGVPPAIYAKVLPPASHFAKPPPASNATSGPSTASINATPSVSQPCTPGPAATSPSPTTSGSTPSPTTPPNSPAPSATSSSPNTAPTTGSASPTNSPMPSTSVTTLPPSPTPSASSLRQPSVVSSGTVSSTSVPPSLALCGHS